jgi:hypothetical protein
MWRLKCLGEHQGRTRVPRPTPDNQVFQDRIFLFHGHNELLQIRNTHPKADTVDVTALLKSKDYLLFICCSEVLMFVNVINDEREVG